MTSKEENKVSMHSKVRTFFSTNQITYADYSGILGKVSEFNDLCTRLILMDGIATQKTTGFTKQKNDQKKLLVQKTLRAMGALRALSSVTHDPGLGDIVKASPSTLDRMRDSNLLVFCTMLNEALVTNANALLIYNIDAAFVTAYKATLDLYKEVLELTGDKRGTKIAAGETVDRLFAEIEDMLDNVIDPLMLGTSFDLPDTYPAYRSARSVTDNASHTTPPDYMFSLEAGEYKVVTTMPYSKSRKIKVSNKSGTSADWSISKEETKFSGSIQTVKPKSVSTKLSSSIATEGDFLLFYNPSNTPGEIDVRIYE